jgi:secretion/DNA translocation related TadE-like protein
MIHKSEDGSTTFLTVALMAAILVIFTSIGFGFRLASEFRLTQQAADLSALAGGALLPNNPNLACTMAEKVAQENGTELEECVVSIGQVEVRVQSVQIRQVKTIAKAGMP